MFTLAIKLMGKMRITWKFTVLAMLFLLPMFYLATIVTLDRVKTISEAGNEQIGVIYLKDLRQLTQTVAQVRGLSSAYLSGDKSVESRLQEKMNQVQTIYKQALANEQQYRDRVNVSTLMELVKDWEATSKRALTSSASAAFNDYSRHIDAIKDFMQYVAGQSGLLLDHELDTHYLMDGAVVQMPHMLDHMGKLRGIGTHVAAAGKFTPEDFTSISEYVNEIKITHNKLDHLLERVGLANKPVANKLAAAVTAFKNNSLALESSTNQNLLKPDKIQITAADYFDTASKTIQSGYVLYDQMIVELDGLLKEHADAFYAEIISMYLVLLVIMLVAGYMYMGLYRGMTESIDELNTVVDAISDGDLTRMAEVNSQDELGSIATNMNAMVEKINALVSQVISAANQVASAANQAETTSNQSREGINRQNMEIEQVATAINEMSATVQEVARSASSAAEQTQKATTDSDSGKRVVNQAMDSINNLSQEMGRATEVIKELETDSDNIGTVLDVIRGIAEQTNLLALNAAIEAARAGEQGRGFAVVADEVRTLASRTQTSTEEIQQMIQKLQQGAQNAVQVMEQGNAKTDESVRLAAEAGAALEAIASAVLQINDMNSQIASAAEEQSSVASEIDRNVINIRDIAAETVEGAEQTAASSQSMNQVAGQLMSLVKEFKV